MIFINCYCTVRKEKFLMTCISIDSHCIRKAVTTMYNCITGLFLYIWSISLTLFFVYSLYFSFRSTFLCWWLLMLCLKLKSDGEAYFKGHYGSSRHLLDLAGMETCLCASRLRAKWFLSAGVKLMADCSVHLVQLRGKKHFLLVLLCLPSSTEVPW